MAKTPHRAIQIGLAGQQFQNPSGKVDSRFGMVGASGIDINHGWKIHADFEKQIALDDFFYAMGRSATGEITDAKTAKEMDTLLGKVGMSYDEFKNAFIGNPSKKLDGAGLIGTIGGQQKYMHPLPVLETMGVMEDLGMQYKLSGGYRQGRHLTAYPQTLERRDQVITALNERVGGMLQSQGDRTYRAGLGSTGAKNAPLSGFVSGRFTTDYADINPDGTPNFRESSSGPTESKYSVSGKVSEREAQRINNVLAAEPAFQEILHGSPGYKSPYATIEDVFERRVSGAIPPSPYSKEMDEEIVYGNTRPSRAPDPITTKIAKTSEEAKAVTAAVATPVKKADITVTGPVEKADVTQPAPKAIIETTKDGRPVLKVGTPVKKAEEPIAKERKRIPLKAGKVIETKDAAKGGSDIDDKKIDMSGVLDDALSVATSPKEASEALAEKAKEKMDPTKKVEERVEKEKEKAQEQLLENIIETDNARFRSAAGKAPVDTAFKKKLVEGITSVTGKAPGRTTMELLDAGEGLAGSVISAAKNGKNLRLAGTAALLSVAGFAIGKGRDKIGNQPDGPMGPDEASNLRRSLMSDG